MDEPKTVTTTSGHVFFTHPDVTKLLEGPKDAIPPPAGKEREERHMSRSEAITILMRLSTERTRTEEEVTALQMGALRLMMRSFQRQRNWARRRRLAAENAPSAAEVPSAPHEPEQPGEFRLESETVKRQEAN